MMSDQEQIEHLLAVIRQFVSGIGFARAEDADAALHGIERIARRRLVGLPEREWDALTKKVYDKPGWRLPNNWDLSNEKEVFALIRQIEPEYKMAVQNPCDLDEADLRVLQWHRAAMALRHCLLIRELGFSSDGVRNKLIPDLHVLAFKMFEHDALFARREGASSARRDGSRAANAARTARLGNETKVKLEAVERQITLQQQAGGKPGISSAVAAAADELGMTSIGEINALRNLWYAHRRNR